MPVLKAIFENQDDIPEQYRELYVERDGQYELAGIEGVKTQADVDRLQRAAAKEREEHKKTRDALKVWDGLDPEEIRTKLDRYDELEIAASEKIDDDKINSIVEARVKSRVAPLERDKGTLAEQLQAAQETISALTQKDQRRRLKDYILEKAKGAGCDDRAHDWIVGDAAAMFEENEEGQFVTRDGVGVTPGVSAEVWFTEMQAKRELWWGPSVGGGATGSRGGGGGVPNPWSGDHWNATEQARIVRTLGEAKARQMAKAAGVNFDRPVRPKPKA
jgi:hypothetical protein